MRIMVSVFMGMMTLAGCSVNPTNTAETTYNDAATGTNLLGADLNGRMSPADRVAQLAQCSAVLTVHVGQSPPPERADRLRQLADRLQRTAVAFGETNGQTATQVNQARDTAVAAIRQMAANHPSLYAQAMAQALDRCGLAEVMTDDELTGRGGPALPGNDLVPMPTN